MSDRNSEHLIFTKATLPALRAGVANFLIPLSVLALFIASKAFEHFGFSLPAKYLGLCLIGYLFAEYYLTSISRLSVKDNRLVLVLSLYTVRIPVNAIDRVKVYRLRLARGISFLKIKEKDRSFARFFSFTTTDGQFVENIATLKRILSAYGVRLDERQSTHHAGA